LEEEKQRLLQALSSTQIPTELATFGSELKAAEEKLQLLESEWLELIDLTET
jgi:hypothetical protein